MIPLQKVRSIRIVDHTEPLPGRSSSEDVCSLSRHWEGQAVLPGRLKNAFHDYESRVVALDHNHLALRHNEAVVEVISDGIESSTDLLLADRIQARLHDKRRIIGIEAHEGVEIFCRDCAISGFDDLFERVEYHNRLQVLGWCPARLARTRAFQPWLGRLSRARVEECSASQMLHRVFTQSGKADVLNGCLASHFDRDQSPQKGRCGAPERTAPALLVRLERSPSNDSASSALVRS